MHERLVQGSGILVLCWRFSLLVLSAVNVLRQCNIHCRVESCSSQSSTRFGSLLLSPGHSQTARGPPAEASMQGVHMVCLLPSCTPRQHRHSPIQQHHCIHIHRCIQAMMWHWIIPGSVLPVNATNLSVRVLCITISKCNLDSEASDCTPPLPSPSLRAYAYVHVWRIDGMVAVQRVIRPGAQREIQGQLNKPNLHLYHSI